MSAMAKVYADLIMKGKKTLDDIPASIYDDVVEVLTERGWVFEE